MRTVTIYMALCCQILLISNSSYALASSTCGQLWLDNPANLRSLFFNEIEAYAKDLIVYTSFNYSKYKKILFLSDGNKTNPKSEKFNEKLVVSTDYDIFKSGNVRVDNNALPFKSDSFDLIVMSKGLCPCHSERSCGGILVEKESMRRFLKEVISVLDKNNKNSLAVLTGFFFWGPYGELAIKYWYEVISEEAYLNPEIQISPMIDPNSRHKFVGIAISPGKNMSNRLNELINAK